MLDEHLVDLVVMDHHAQATDGLQMIKLMSQRHPSVRKAILTAEPNEEIKTAFLDVGIDIYLEKPASMDAMESVFRTLNELASWHAEKGFRGLLHGLQLQTVLQIVCFGANSGVMEIFSGSLRGEVYIEHGFVVHASIAGHTGKPALGLLFSLEEGSFKLSPFAAPPEQTLSLGWEMLTQPFPVPEILVEAEPQFVEAENETVESAAVTESNNAAFPEEMFAPQIEEMLVCSSRGEILFESQCPDPDRRLRFMQAVSQKSLEISEAAGFGRFDRVEIEAAETRAIVHARPSGLVFLQAKREVTSVS
jgi:CheY-like chemotaxis protein